MLFYLVGKFDEVYNRSFAFLCFQLAEAGKCDNRINGNIIADYALKGFYVTVILMYGIHEVTLSSTQILCPLVSLLLTVHGSAIRFCLYDKYAVG